MLDYPALILSYPRNSAVFYGHGCLSCTGGRSFHRELIQIVREPKRRLYRFFGYSELCSILTRDEKKYENDWEWGMFG